MFYRPGVDPHGLAFNPFKALVAPRPIGWISTLDADGRPNLAPYSFFNAVADAPPMVLYGSSGRKTDRDEGKDTLANIRATGEFVVNVTSHALRQAMNASSASLGPEVDEFRHAGLTPAPSRVVAPPRVAEAPASLECRLWRVVELPGADNAIAIGEVVGIHIAPEVIVEGRVDVTLYQPLARLGYRDYSAVTEVFALERPDHSDSTILS
jgi:flavin reductase (DIM6/NTAB) family NADH-FMN oxidoreductase RutF